MIQAERIKAILELLNEQGSVSVDDLASRLDVSPMTIRRDLDSCDKEGLLTRCHGGAFIRKPSITEVAHPDRPDRLDHPDHQDPTACLPMKRKKLQSVVQC